MEEHPQKLVGSCQHLPITWNLDLNNFVLNFSISNSPPSLIWFHIDPRGSLVFQGLFSDRPWGLLRPLHYCYDRQSGDCDIGHAKHNAPIFISLWALKSWSRLRNFCFLGRKRWRFLSIKAYGASEWPSTAYHPYTNPPLPTVLITKSVPRILYSTSWINDIYFPVPYNRILHLLMSSLTPRYSSSSWPRIPDHIIGHHFYTEPACSYNIK